MQSVHHKPKMLSIKYKNLSIKNFKSPNKEELKKVRIYISSKKLIQFNFKFNNRQENINLKKISVRFGK